MSPVGCSKQRKGGRERLVLTSGVLFNSGLYDAHNVWSPLLGQDGCYSITLRVKFAFSPFTSLNGNLIKPEEAKVFESEKRIICF